MPSVHIRLREATREAHEAMHRHAGFAAAAAGAISGPDYRDLLARLYGFHAAFDAAMQAAPAALAASLEITLRARSGLIGADLAGLGATQDEIAALPLCRGLPALRAEGDCLGALYVVEGSTLGGAVIARALAPIAGENRRFFLGHRGAQGRLWRSFLQRLERTDAAEAAERAALSTFDVFGRWMADWRGAYRRAA